MLFNPESQTGSCGVLTKLALTWGNFMWVTKKKDILFLPSSMFIPDTGFNPEGTILFGFPAGGKEGQSLSDHHLQATSKRLGGVRHRTSFSTNCGHHTHVT